jgi:hypothetical protein
MHRRTGGPTDGPGAGGHGTCERSSRVGGILVGERVRKIRNRTHFPSSPKYEREDKPRQRRRTVVMDESAPGQGLATLCDARALESRGTS